MSDRCQVPGCRAQADQGYLDRRICSQEMARPPAELDRLLGVVQTPAKPPSVVCMICKRMMRAGSEPASSDVCIECKPGYEESMKYMK